MMPISLLAPAKNIDVARAAIDAGADAVYIGAPRFGARAAAGNSVEDIRELCRYAHVFGVEVDVTINTLLHDSELRDAVSLIWQLYEAGVDAILIQDLRLLSGDTALLGQALPPIRLHASTQCDNRTPERVHELEQMGFQRVVLARELSLTEMRAVRAATACELEAFIHGALCVSYSGRCYLSEAVCGRSANRGECAQMCRLQYDVLDENKQEMLHQKHVLSLLDLQRSEADIRAMIDAGISIFKIEGRLKDADYVRNVVAYYHQMLTRLGVARASRGRVEITFTPNPEKTFHRGATPYFLHTDASEQRAPLHGRPAHLVNMDTPKSTGEYLGTAPIDSSMLHNGDGICFAGEGFYWPNNRVRIPAGTPVYRNLDVEFQRALAAKGATTRVLPIDIAFVETESGFALICAAHEDAAVQPACAARVELHVDKAPASNPDRAEAVIKQQLSKLGGTSFEAASVSISWSSPLFFPASVLNEARRQMVEAYVQMLSAAPRDAGRSVSAVSSNGSAEASAMAALPKELMTCRYCLLYELGQCLRSGYRGPRATYLRQGSLLLHIEPHCDRCEMTISRVV